MVNGDGKKYHSEVFLASSPLVASAYGERCVVLRPTPKIPAAREKPLVLRVNSSANEEKTQATSKNLRLF